jgi:hypothetical protein
MTPTARRGRTKRPRPTVAHVRAELLEVARRAVEDGRSDADILHELRRHPGANRAVLGPILDEARQLSLFPL